MTNYNIKSLPETLPENLDELKKLSDALQTERNLAASNVREGRIAMDEIDRSMKKLKSKVEDIMGIKALSTNPKKPK